MPPGGRKPAPVSVKLGINDGVATEVLAGLKEGDVVRVKVLEVDRQGRVRLSMRNVDAA